MKTAREESVLPAVPSSPQRYFRTPSGSRLRTETISEKFSITVVLPSTNTLASGTIKRPSSPDFSVILVYACFNRASYGSVMHILLDFIV